MTKCPNTNCVEGMVGNVGCAICQQPVTTYIPPMTLREGDHAQYVRVGQRNRGRLNILAASSTKRQKRQAQAMAKADSHFRISVPADEWLKELAAKWGASKAKVLDAILRRKPDPDESYLR